MGPWDVVLRQKEYGPGDHLNQVRVSEKGRVVLARSRRTVALGPVSTPLSRAEAFLKTLQMRAQIQRRSRHAYGNRPDIKPEAYRKHEEEAAELARDLRGEDPELSPPPHRFEAADYQEYLERLCAWGEKAVHLHRVTPITPTPTPGPGTSSPASEDEPAQDEVTDRPVYEFKRGVPTAEAAEVINTRSDYVVAKLERAHRPVGGNSKKKVAELSDIIELYPASAAALRRWANKKYPATEE